MDHFYSERVDEILARAAEDDQQLEEIRSALWRVVSQVYVADSSDENELLTRVRLPMAALGEFTCLAIDDVGCQVTWAEMWRDQLGIIKARFQRNVIAMARTKLKAGDKLDLRERTAYALRKIEFMANALHAILENLNRADPLAAGLCVEKMYTRKKGGVRVLRCVTVMAARVHDIPKILADSPLCIMDATGDVTVWESLLREKPRPMQLVAGLGSVATSAFVPIWRVFQDRAASPHGRVVRVVGDYANSSQLLRTLPLPDVGLASDAQVVGGKLYRGGDMVDVAAAARAVDFAGIRSVATAAGVERWLMARRAEHERAEPGCTIGMIALKPFRLGLEGRRDWTEGMLFSMRGW